jgi:hypothetical protein
MVAVAIEQHEARVNITFQGQNADLPDPVTFDTPDADIIRMVEEAVRGGDVPGLPEGPDAEFENSVVERYDANETTPYNRIMVRPKVPFGS